jgi:hypothetical protein
MRIAIVAAALLGLSATVSADAAPRDRDAWKAARPAGPSVSCIPLNQIRETRVRDDRTIDFYTRGRTVYRNVLPNSCPSLGFERRFAYKTSINQLCNVDIITVFSSPPVMRGASCGLGEFQPVTGAGR